MELAWNSKVCGAAEIFPMLFWSLGKCREEASNQLFTRVGLMRISEHPVRIEWWWRLRMWSGSLVTQGSCFGKTPLSIQCIKSYCLIMVGNSRKVLQGPSDGLGAELPWRQHSLRKTEEAPSRLQACLSVQCTHRLLFTYSFAVKKILLLFKWQFHFLFPFYFPSEVYIQYFVLFSGGQHSD